MSPNQLRRSSPPRHQLTCLRYFLPSMLNQGSRKPRNTPFPRFLSIWVQESPRASRLWRLSFLRYQRPQRKLLPCRGLHRKSLSVLPVRVESRFSLWTHGKWESRIEDRWKGRRPSPSKSVRALRCFSQRTSSLQPYPTTVSIGFRTICIEKLLSALDSSYLNSIRLLTKKAIQVERGRSVGICCLRERAWLSMLLSYAR